MSHDPDAKKTSDLPYGKIYSLHDPHTGELRYIGQTTGSIKERLQGHLKDSAQTHKANWLRSLSEPPEVRLVCFAYSRDELDLLEVHHIARCRNEGCALTNTAAGGHGGRSGPKSAEECQRISASLKGRKLTLEHRRKLSEAKVGRKQSPELIAKRTGKPVSQETRDKMSAALRGKTWTAEAKARMSMIATGRKHTDETKAKLTGLKHSPETRAKLRAASQAYQQRLREQKVGGSNAE